MKNKVATIGALSLDNVSFHDRRNHSNVFGGAAGYAAIASSFFTDTSIISSVGSDYPDELFEALREKGIDVLSVKIKEALSSTRFKIAYDEELKEIEGGIVELNVLERGIELPQKIQEFKYVYIAGNHPDIQNGIIGGLNCDSVIALSTHLHWISKYPNKVKDLMKKADIVFIKDNEMCRLMGRKQMTNAARDLLKAGMSHLIVRKGEHGAVLFQPDKMFPFIAYDKLNMDFIDPTGCGGVLAGAFLGFLAECDGLSEKVNNQHFKALALGLVVRSFKIEDVSYNRLLDLTKEDIWRRYDQFRDMFNK